MSVAQSGNKINIMCKNNRTSVCNQCHRQLTAERVQECVENFLEPVCYMCELQQEEQEFNAMTFIPNNQREYNRVRFGESDDQYAKEIRMAMSNQ